MIMVSNEELEQRLKSLSEKWEAERIQMEERSRIINLHRSEIISHVSLAQDFEKAKDIDSAIVEYNHAITLGRAYTDVPVGQYRNAYERISMLYHKKKDYMQEARVLDLLLQFDASCFSPAFIAKMQERKDKVQSLL